MKTENLIDAIGMIDEKYIAEAHKPQIRHSVKKFAIAAAAVLCIAVPLPVMMAFGSDTAYSLLYMAMPSVAQTFKPIQKSCEDNGVRMEVISSDIHGDEADFYISVQGDMIDETTDLFDSYNIRCPFDNVGNVSFSDFDESTKTAYFVVNIRTMNGEEIPKSKITFSVRELIFDKHEFEGAVDGVDLLEVPENPPTIDNINFRGGSENYESITNILAPSSPLTEITDGVSVTGIGYIDGKLHVQTYYEDILKTDNHGYVYLVDKNNRRIGEDFASISFWDDDRKGSYDEKVFDIEYSELENYSLYGKFWTSDGYKSGDWEVTFRTE
ncbi:MAG: hypothetical protein J6B74_03555 [Ruminococcus sp.]|nr:hypothetical protein [Ruminococcus sp.]